jgi:hypothetical protein
MDVVVVSTWSPLGLGAAIYLKMLASLANDSCC